MGTIKLKISVMAITAFTVFHLGAATAIWTNGSGDGYWSNPANWKNGDRPASNDVVQIYNDCPNAPQNIILDEDAWLSYILLRSSGDRHVTITPVNNEFIRLSGSPALQGTYRTVDITFNCDILVGAASLRIRTEGGSTIFNNRIYPSPTERSSAYLLVELSNPLVLAASNSFSQVDMSSEAHIIVKHPHALGDGALRGLSPGPNLVELHTNAFIKGAPTPYFPIHFTMAESGASDITLDILDRSHSGEIRVLPRGANASGKLAIRFPNFITAMLSSLWLEDFATLIYDNPSGESGWGHSNYGIGQGVVSGPGNVVINGDVVLSCTNNYTGGTIISNGTIRMSRESTLPTNGTVKVIAGATLSGYSTDKKHDLGLITGDGRLTMAEFTILQGLEPGDDGPGTLTLDSSAKLVMGPDCVSTFELDSLEGPNDFVKMTHSSSHLGLGGTLRIVNLGGLERGAYKLFDLSGPGRVTNEFRRVEMPKASAGRVEVADNGDVVLHVTRLFGTVLTIR